MHRMISTVFKILILSMLFMFILDTTLIMVEIISINSRISNIAGTMQNEIARNNCMPTALVGTFTNYLDEIENNSTIMDISKTTGLKDITTNLTQSVTIDSKNYPSLTPDNAKEYGEFTTLVIQATLHPSFVYYNADRRDGDEGMLKSGRILNYNLKYIYSIPCLRYLK